MAVVGYRHEHESGPRVPAPPQVATDLPDWLVATVFGFHAEIRRRVRARGAEGRQEELSSVVAAGSGDVSDGIDIPALRAETARRAAPYTSQAAAVFGRWLGEIG